MGRPKNPENQNKKNTNVWLKENDYQNLRTKAKAAGKTYSAYCENVLLSKSPKVYSHDYKLLMRDINRIGNNINQIARKLNLTKSDQITVDNQLNFGQEVLKELEEIKRMIKDTSR